MIDHHFHIRRRTICAGNVKRRRGKRTGDLEVTDASEVDIVGKGKGKGKKPE